MTDKLIQVGDLVTISVNEFQVTSNTYRVARKLENESVLSHPLAPDCYIIRQDSDLNNSFPSMQSQVEKCLAFAQRNKDALGHTMAEELDGLCFYLVIKKSLTAKKRADLASICGKIAAVTFGHNISAAVSTIKQNKVLLDEYNHTLYASSTKFLNDPLSIVNKVDRYKIFNIAGFLLAQLSNS